ncbi:unnamed protein product [Polarella glacialis]|uniref:Chloride channel protein n=1 Tax=Polarella glacialis TaxID=89957 RepID=A0A813DJ72_POLGL|nr:unnamed protein product [Polarella glacialis]
MDRPIIERPMSNLDFPVSREVSLGSMVGLDAEAGLATDEHGHQNGGGGNPILAGMEAPWANDRFFLADSAGLALLATLIGYGSYWYNYVIGDMLEDWLSRTGERKYPSDIESLHLMGGAPLWIPLVWAGCTAVGVMKVLLRLDQYPSFLTEIRAEHADPKESAKVVVCCLASLYSGAALGPEAGLASGGGGLGTVLAELISKLGGASFQRGAEARRRLFVLGGITAAFGSIMPAPWVALMICMECAFAKRDEDGKEMIIWGRRTLFLLGFTASWAFVVRYAVEPIPELPLSGSKFDERYDNWMPVKAILLGAIAAFSALVYFVITAVIKVAFAKIGRVIEARLGVSARIIALCSLAGLITGVLGYCVPLSLTDGKAAMAPTALHAPGLSSVNLLCIALAKTACFGAAAAGGLVGGPFFPVLYIGMVVGELVSRIQGLGFFPAFTVPVVMVAMPGAVFPIPFTMVAFPLSMLKLGPLWCVPVLVGVLTSYTLLVGTGFVRKLAGGAGRG